MSALHLSSRAWRTPPSAQCSLALVASLGLAAWLGLAGGSSGRARALEPAAARARRPTAEPVGAVDDDDLLKAGAQRCATG